MIANLFKFLFYPIGACFLGGTVYSFLIKRNKNDLYWIIFISVLFMMGWRQLFHSAMISSRYYSIILYPALIITAYSSFNLGKVLHSIANLINNKNKASYLLSQHFIHYCLLCALVATCLIKAVKHDQYSMGLVNACSFFQYDQNNKKHVLTYVLNGTEDNRIRYYSNITDPQGLQNLFITGAGNPDNNYEVFMRVLNNRKNYWGSHYFFLFKKMDAPQVKATQDVLKNGNMKQICRFFVSHTKKRDINLYRYEPYCHNIEIWNREIPEIASTNKCPNPGFEEELTEDEYKSRIKHYQEIGASDFYTQKENAFPQAWMLGVSEAESIDGISPEISLCRNNPISGKYSLEINGNDVGTGGINSSFIDKQDGRYSGFIRAFNKTDVEVTVCYWDNSINSMTFLEQYRFLVLPNILYRFLIPVYESSFPEDAKRVCIVIQTDGHVLLDNIEFTP